MAWKCPSDPGASLCGRSLHLLDGQGAPEGEPGRTWQEEPQSWIPSGQELRLTKWVCPFGLVNTSDDTVAQNKVSMTQTLVVGGGMGEETRLSPHCPEGLQEKVRGLPSSPGWAEKPCACRRQRALG